MRILLIEDEKGVVRFVSKGLREEAYVVDVASSAEEAEEKIEAHSYDVLILDIMLPGQSGFEFLRHFRNRDRDTPVLILTARDSIGDKRKGFESECDDYLTKPFHFEELLMRLRALLRRKKRTLRSSLSLGPLTLNPDTYEVSLEDKPIRLTKKEFNLLRYFLTHPRKVLNRTQILNHVWNNPRDPGTNVVDVTVGALRKKIHKGKDGPRIETVYGVGYALQYSDEE